MVKVDKAANSIFENLERILAALGQVGLKLVEVCTCICEIYSDAASHYRHMVTAGEFANTYQNKREYSEETSIMLIKAS